MTCFLVQTRAPGEEALRAVAANCRLRREKGPRRGVAYLDTFDWRLHGAGGVLAFHELGEGGMLRWEGTDGSLRRQARLAEPPAFAWDLPPGPLREALAPLLEMRRLLPVVRVQAVADRLSVLDERDKTVARLELACGTAAVPGSRSGRRLPAILRVEPVKGYKPACEPLLRLLADDLGLPRMEESELAVALAAIGREAGDYRSKPSLELDPSMRADEAMKIVHRSLLETMLRNEDGVLRDLDSEFLHDFRVAGRRTRSALTQVKGVFPPAAVERFRRGFSWLGKATGPTRDMDVYLLKMKDYQASLPEAVRQNLGPLDEFLHRHQRLEQRRLARVLRGTRYARLKREWKQFLTRPLPASSPLPHAERPISAVASERIWKSYRRVQKKGKAIRPETEAVALHRLRIECKKLRYLLEFFRGLYPASEVALLVRELKRLQDCLGDFNDYEVQQAALVQFAGQMVEEDLALVETLMAMGRLVERLELGQAAERQRVHKRFGRFDRRRNRNTFRRLFKRSGDRVAA